MTGLPRRSGVDRADPDGSTTVEQLIDVVESGSSTDGRDLLALPGTPSRGGSSEGEPHSYLETGGPMKTSLRLGTLTLGLLALSLARSGSAADRDRDGKPPLPAPAVAHGSPVARGKTPPALAAPVIASCGESDGNATATWGAVTDATKYSVEFVVGYDLTGADGCADAFLEFEYSTTDTTITVPLTDFDNNFCDEVTPCV